MEIILIPYNMRSEGAKNICKNSGGAIKLVNPNKSSKNINIIKHRALIKWGSVLSCDGYGAVFNLYNDRVINKKIFFELCKEKSWCLPFTTSKDKANEWLSQGYKVIGREKLSSSGGDGIVIYIPGDTIKDLPLYTKYIKKSAEYRVHVVDGAIIKAQKKVMKMHHQPNNGWEVRSHNNGFLFQSCDLSTVPQEVMNAAIESVHHCGLNFGGVDVIWNATKAKAYVLEINSAPGIEGDTVIKYVDALKKMVSDRTT